MFRKSASDRGKKNKLIEIINTLADLANFYTIQ